jgi:hypothetical protein
MLVEMPELALKKPSRWFYYCIGFFPPIILAILAHIGILCSFQIKLSSLAAFVEYLSTLSTNTVAVQVLIGIATISVVFFSFVQFGYSIRHVPSIYVSDYILKHKYSILLISFQISSITISAFYSFYPKVYHITDAFLALITASNVLAISCYFFWMIRVTKLPEMVNLILSGINLKGLLVWERTIQNKSKSMSEYLGKRSKSIFPITTPSPYCNFFLSKKDLIVRSNIWGVVENIDLVQIDKSVVGISNHIESIELFVSPGQLLRYSDEPLFKLIPKTKNTSQITKDEKAVREFIASKSDILRSCIIINQEEYTRLTKSIDDIILVYQHVASQTSSELSKVVDELSKFIHDDRWNENKDGYSVSTHILKQFVESLKEVSGGTFNHEQLKSIITLVYALRDHAIKRNDLYFLKELINLMSRILWEMINRSEYYNPRIATFVLYYKEIIFSYELTKRIDNESLEGFKDSWNTFYSELISFAIQSAIEVMYYLVANYFKRPTEEMRLYLLHNAETLTNFLDRMIHWNHLEEKERKNKQQEFAHEVIAWSFFSFRAYYYGDKIPANIVTDIAFLMADLSNRSMVFDDMANDELLTQLFFNTTFKHNLDFDRYDDPDLVTAATHTGGTPIMDDYWIALNLWRAKRNKQFIPTKIADDEEVANQIITGLLDGFTRIRKIRLQLLFNIEENELKELLEKYRVHLNVLNESIFLNKNKLPL